MLEGLVFGLFLYSIAFFIALASIQKNTVLTKPLFLVLCLSWFGHYVGSAIYASGVSDSLVTFFEYASPTFHGFGTAFVQYMVWYVRALLTGESYEATLYFFSVFAFLGSVLWYMVFLQLSEAIELDYYSEALPALVIMCWPSFFLFTSGIGKDSLSFFLIPSIFVLSHRLTHLKKRSPLLVVGLVCVALVMFMIRPYLFMLLSLVFFLTYFREAIFRFTARRMFLLLALSPLIFYIIERVLILQGGLEDVNLTDIANRALLQQSRLNTGTAFPILSDNPFLVPFLLPYGFTMNLLMPMFVFAHNTVAFLASFENLGLFYMIVRFWKQRAYWKVLRDKVDSVRRCFYLFVVGMSYLGILNTNLGLAMRQKSMYVPAFLVIAMLVHLYSKQCKHQRHDDLNAPQYTARENVSYL